MLPREITIKHNLKLAARTCEASGTLRFMRLLEQRLMPLIETVATPYIHARRAAEDPAGRTVLPMIYTTPNLEAEDRHTEDHHEQYTRGFHKPVYPSWCSNYRRFSLDV